MNIIFVAATYFFDAENLCDIYNTSQVIFTLDGYLCGAIG